MYNIKWGDGEIEEWIGPFPSGEEVILNKTWSEEGDYTIMAKARDSFGAESDWAEFEVSITKKSRSINIPFLTWLQSHLNLFPILQILLQRIGLQ